MRVVIVRVPQRAASIFKSSRKGIGKESKIMFRKHKAQGKDGIKGLALFQLNLNIVST